MTARDALPQVLVTHPGRQHSHQAAIALAHADMLAGYWAGVPCLVRHRGVVPGSVWRRFIRYAPVLLPEDRVRWHPATPALRRIGDTILPLALAQWVDFWACRQFDRWAASRLPKLRPVDAVIACEVSALSTFRTANRLGITRILDAPSIHHQAQDRLHGFSETRALHGRITRLKDKEIALADHIVTVSQLAADTYIEAGVPREKVHSVMLGADTDLFAPRATLAKDERKDFLFVFAGAMIQRKGFDLVVEAFTRVRHAEPRVGLEIVGPTGDAFYALPRAAHSGISVLGSLRQAELAQRFHRADCLVLPSRSDSYGMVVAEALAAGLPVIISGMVGAKELVREGVNGWVVQAGDVESIAERMLWCARHRGEVRAMRPACLASAEAADWAAYQRRLRDLIVEIAAVRAN
jgi:glycosyltransferase involved in cell wall biosynthesis